VRRGLSVARSRRRSQSPDNALSSLAPAGCEKAGAYSGGEWPALNDSDLAITRAPRAGQKGDV
jgi:hypothetical protein